MRARIPAERRAATAAVVTTALRAPSRGLAADERRDVLKGYKDNEDETC